MEQKIFNMQGEQMFRRDIKRSGLNYVKAMTQLSSVSSIDNSLIRDNTKWSNDEITAARFQFERDELGPLVTSAIQNMLAPWSEIPTGYPPATNGDLPFFTLKSLSRNTGLSSEKLRDLLEKYPPTFRLNGEMIVAQLEEWPDKIAPSDNAKLTQASKYNVSPKKIIRASRYQSRPPGGGVIQKSGLLNDKIGPNLRKAAQAERKIRFVTLQKQNLDELGVMPELEIDNGNMTVTLSPEQIIYQEPNGDRIMNVFRWLKNIGFGKNWVLDGNENLLAQQLVKFSRGEQVDFNIWNCIGFKWFDENGEFPSCEINNNLDAAISLYFQKRIMEIAQALSTIGNPNLFILIPSNEAFDTRLWNYRQPLEVRESIINDAVSQLQNIYDQSSIAPNALIKIMRWDEYLEMRGLSYASQEYSDLGEQTVRDSPKAKQIMSEAIRSGRTYFEGQQIEGLSDDILSERQLRYYGVYAGEGVAFKEMSDRNQSVVVINFEEMRVSQMAYKGAQANLAVVTPIKPNEMNDYYQWKQAQTAKR